MLDPHSVNIFTSISKSRFSLFLKPAFIIKYFIIIFSFIFVFLECVPNTSSHLGSTKSLNRVLEESSLPQSLLWASCCSCPWQGGPAGVLPLLLARPRRRERCAELPGTGCKSACFSFLKMRF